MKSIFPLAILSGLMLTLSSPLQAADPQVSRLTPYGGQRSTEVTVTFSGSRLSDAEEIVTYEPGLIFSDLAVPEDKKGNVVTAKVTIPNNCRLGGHHLRIRTKSGLSPICTFFVGTLPVVNEKEPNTDFSSPQVISPNVTVHGRIDNEDVDHFAVSAKKGERLSVEVEGLRVGTLFYGRNFFDPYIAILNKDRFELATCDDIALCRQDGCFSIIVPEDGQYIVQIRDASYGGHSASLYRLHIGHFPRPTGFVPAGGRPGESLTVKFLGDAQGEFEQQVVLPRQTPPNFGILPEKAGMVTPTPVSFRVNDLPNAIEAEPNNKIAEATAISVPGAGNGYLADANDVDYFKISMKKNQQVDLELFGRRLRSSIDSVLYVYDKNGKNLSSDDDRRRPDSWIRFKAPADGDYFLRVRDQLNQGGPDYFYRLEVTPVVPKLTVTTNEVTRYIQSDVEIPTGRRVAFLATVRRENFGGAVNFLAENLPQGVTMECPAAWASDGVVPIMFHAAEKLPRSAQIATLNAKWVHPSNQAVTAETKVEQHHLRIRGRNQNDYVFKAIVDTIPIAITDAIPFDIKIVEPKVPIVQGGTMNLKVVATRAEGFDGEIQVLLLQNPPGVSSNRSVKIAKGKNEAVIPMNASSKAPLRESQITVRGLATVGNARIEICSPFAKFRVAERYLNFKYVNSAVEQGGEIQYPVTIEKVHDFEGKAKVELVGIPGQIKTEPLEITKDDTEIAFQLKVAPDARVQEHKNLFCRVTIMENGEPILHQLGSGRLRVNKPAPVKKAAPAPKPAPKAVAKAEPPKKVLSRLEMLREQQKAARQAAN